MVLCAAIVVICIVIMLVCQDIGLPLIAGILKMTASTAFLALALLAGAFHSAYGVLVFIALFFSWWGDLLLIFRHRALFLTGLVAFFLAHLGYAAAFVVEGPDLFRSAGALVLLALPAAGVAWWLRGRLGEMRIPVYAYIGVISIMVALSAGLAAALSLPLLFIGAAAFYVSDVFVARDRFVCADHWNRWLGLPLYYGAQMILAYSIAPVSAM